MPILDKLNFMGEAQAVTVAAASTDYLDLGAAGKNAFDQAQMHEKGGGSEVFFNMLVTTAAAAAGAATVTVTLEGADDTGFSTNKVVLVGSDAIPKATLVQGYKWRVAIPAGFRKRYLRAYFTIGTGPLTAGNFSTFLDIN
jgi:hypothetical protein